MIMRKYRPETCVWELTTECNLKCRHCASSCSKEGRADELSQKEVEKVTEQIIALGVKWVSLTGGELLISESWYPAAELLEKNGVHVHMITNGTLLSDSVIRKLKSAGVSMVSVSLDGTREIHDFIRGDGVYKKACDGIQRMEKAGIWLYHQCYEEEPYGIKRNERRTHKASGTALADTDGGFRRKYAVSKRFAYLSFSDGRIDRYRL